MASTSRRSWIAPRDQVRRVWTPSGIAKALGDAAGPSSDVSLVQGSLFADDDETDDESVAPGERFGAAVGRRQPDTDDHEATDPGNRKEPGPNDRPSRRGGRFGTAKGSAVHAVMQQVALDDPTRGLASWSMWRPRRKVCSIVVTTSR